MFLKSREEILSMLVDLKVKNFVLIEELEINFKKGLNILTGETGAGKSIIIGALNMLLGSRASTDIIRNGKNVAYIEAVYEPDKLKKINKILKESGIEPDEILLLSREIKLNGRNRSRINGQLATLKMIRKISQYLVDIHGQHEHQSLLNNSEHQQILDEFIGNEIKNLKSNVKEKYLEIKNIEDKLSDMEINEAEKARKLDMLEFQIDEIENAELEVGEFEELINEFEKLSNMEEIYSTIGEIVTQLNGESFENKGTLDKIGNFRKSLGNIKNYDSQIDNFYEQINDVFYQLQDFSFEIEDYHNKLEFNEQKLNQIQERLDLIQDLKKKYGSSIKEVLEYKDKIKKEKNELQSQEKLINDLKKEKKKLTKEFNKLAHKLSEIRKKYAEEMEQNIQKQLQDLAMKNTIFKVDFSEKSPSQTGIDQIEFQISTNPGEDLKSLNKIASGGELSRIMLALKTIIADIDKVDTLIFDEIDSGVGGKVAQKMAEKLNLISLNRQIICITHLPQIASMSDNHFFITKETGDSKTITRIYQLDRQGKKEELARMLGGVKTTKTTMEHAQEMMEMAENKKEALSE